MFVCLNDYMKLLYGKPIADKILERLKSGISSYDKKPGIAVILIGNDEASRIYVDLKEKRAKDIGMNFFRFDLPENVYQEEVIERIEKLNNDELVHGIIVQLPLPFGFETDRIIATIDPEKDADGFLNKSEILLPVFPKAIIRMIESSSQEIEGKNAVVIANSREFGKKMSEMLANKNLKAQYLLSSDLFLNLGKVETADVVVSAVGSPGLISAEMIKDGAVVVDGGIEKVGEKVMGDVNIASFEGKNVFLTPVPGGVGPVTIACLLENVFLAFEAQQKEK
jgi:methylenetetrahydrofolate dehydrogenase (NADP+)/methenyltetrahydrofolate cyclohydrolase